MEVTHFMARKPQQVCLAWAGHPFLLHFILKIFLACSKLFSLMGGFLWLPGCRNFFTVGRLLTLVFRACSAQGHSFRMEPKPNPIISTRQGTETLLQGPAESPPSVPVWGWEPHPERHEGERKKRQLNDICPKGIFLSDSFQFQGFPVSLLTHKSCGYITLVQQPEEECICQGTTHIKSPDRQ